MMTENKIIKTMIEKNSAMTIRKLAKTICADYKITHTAVQRLIHKKILSKQDIGKSSLCSLNKRYYGEEILIVEEERKKELLKNKNLLTLYSEIMKKAKTSLFIFLIFGSYAKRTYNIHSDIDLIFISNELKFEEQIEEIISVIPLKIHALVFNEGEFRKMAYSRESNVIQEALKNNIILYGIENFYKLKND